MYEIYTIEHVIAGMKQHESVAFKIEAANENHKLHNQLGKFIKKQKLILRLFMRGLQSKEVSDLRYKF